MLRVLSCIAYDHDIGLLVLAVVVCATGSWTGIKTYLRALKETQEQARLNWIAIAAVSMASAVWATHFIAMLAYRPSLQTGWDVPLSVASLLVAIACTGCGLLIATNRRIPLGPELGGAVLGCGITGMHYLGMEAFEVAGRIQWDVSEVVASIVIGVGFATLSMSRAARRVTRFCKYGATVSLILAISGLHFTAMAAVTIIPDPSIGLGAGAVANGAFGYVTAAVAMLVIGTSFAGYAIDSRTSSAIIHRMHKLANATTEGIVIARDGAITDANDRFVGLVGRPLESFVGSVPSIFWDRRADSRGQSEAGEFDSEIIGAGQTVIPVHIVRSAGMGNEVIYAIRDLRSKRADEARIEHMARYDGLTGLANRTTFLSAVDVAIAAEAPFAILYVDLDRFKEINDSNGHAAGDAVLVETARRMRHALPGATIARLGGDEFAILKPLDGGDDDDGADAVAATLSKPIMRNGASLRSGASVGAARFPLDGRDRSMLIGNADIAMYAAKADRKSGVRRFEASMGEAVRRRRILVQDLSGAVQRGEMEVYYQVQTSVQSGKTIGFEALVRWHHPVFGTTSPMEFIPLAEENGSIVDIGAWVLRRACCDAALWPHDLKVAVNLSPAQFDHEIEATIEAALAESGLSPRRLEVEITESILISDLDRTLEVLNRIKAMGPSIAMDDFGTGYSSLSSLQAFPFDKIKIDRSFVDKLDSSPQAAAIVRAVVNLGHSLNIPVMAEGVETQIHLDFLRKQGCAGAQGYLMGRPTPLAGTLQHLPAVGAEAA